MAGSATRSRENTRARLLDAAAQVFAEVGLEGASVEAVCERAGFTRGAFYSNFDSKDELFFALAKTVGDARLVAVRERVTALAEEGALDDCDPIDLVQQIMYTAADDRLTVMLLSEIRTHALRDQASGAAYLAQEREMLEGIAAMIEEIVESGTIELRLDAALLAQLLLIVWEGMAVRGAMEDIDEATRRRQSSDALGRLVKVLMV